MPLLIARYKITKKKKIFVEYTTLPQQKTEKYLFLFTNLLLFKYVLNKTKRFRCC